jgi:hypothetical protein
LASQNQARRATQHSGSTVVCHRSGYSHSRCGAHRLLSAAMALCLCASGAGRASASSSWSTGAGQPGASEGHSCRCNGCRGAESCCCSGTHEPDTTARPLTPTGSTLASAPCVGSAPCRDASIPDAGPRTRVPGTAIVAEFHRTDRLLTGRLLAPRSVLAMPPDFISRLEDPPECGPSLPSSR